MDDEIVREKEIFAELARAKGGATSLKIQNEETDHEALAHEAEGQLTVDVFQDADNIYIQSTVAGVNPDDLDVNITKDAVTIRGERQRSQRVMEKDFFYQECFWGSFSRSVVLPQEIDPEQSAAALKNGVLTVKMPKLERRRTKTIKVKADS